MNEVRDKAAKAFVGLCETASDITNANDIQMSKRRTAGCQRHRENFQQRQQKASSSKHVYPISMDHIVSHLNDRFQEKIKKCCIVSLCYVDKLTNEMIQFIVNEYREELNFVCKINFLLQAVP